MGAIDEFNTAQREMGKPAGAVDLALHLGEVLYGNIGAVDRLDFTVIGPAVNEAARIEVLCEPLGRRVLVSAELAAVVADKCRLVPVTLASANAATHVRVSPDSPLRAPQRAGGLETVSRGFGSPRKAGQRRRAAGQRSNCR